MTHTAFAALAAIALFTSAQSSNAQAPPVQGQAGQAQTQTEQDKAGQNKGQGQGKGDSARTQGKNDQNSAERTNMTNGNMSVTGCLQRGSTGDTYTITGTDGKRYDLKTSNNSVKLADHVGHRVTVMSTASGGGAPTSQNQSGNKSNEPANQSSTNQQGNSTSGMMDVTTLTMVSASCQ